MPKDLLDVLLVAKYFADVTTCHKEIAKIVPGGVIDESGVLHEIDILVCATGFNLAFAPSLYVVFIPKSESFFRY